jgi:hypothetical protein
MRDELFQSLLSGGFCSVLVALLLVACAPDLVVGTWACATDPIGDGNAAPVNGTIAAPSTIDFEHEFCDYPRALGFCYTDPDAAYEIVDAPVHSGRRAAEFSITSDPARDGQQARCVRQGAVPKDATYGAWYFLPSSTSNAGTWNLMHFQGGADITAQHGMWDVSLGNTDDGGRTVILFDFARNRPRLPVDAPRVPIGAWFHLEFRWRRAADASGEVAVYQDGQQVLTLTELATDDSEWVAWYVGSYSNELTPPNATVYVDDVSIQAAP